MQGESLKTIFLLSAGARTTEDLYFLDTAAPYLKKRHGFTVRRIDTLNRRPLQKSAFKDSVVIICRTLPEGWLQYLFDHRPAKVIYLIDDYFAGAASSLDLPARYRQKISRIDSLSRQIIDLADHLVVSSQFLYDYYQKLVEKSLTSVWLLRPALHPSAYSPPRLISRTAQIAYHGTSSHYKDLERIEQPLLQTLDEEGAQFFSLLGRAIPQSLSMHRSVRTIRPFKWPIYKRVRKIFKAHIGLSPLFETDFNRGKSIIKFIDIAALGAVGIYSDRAPYNSLVEDGLTGLLAEDDPRHWHDCLQRLIKDPNKTLHMAQACQEKSFAIAHPRWHYRFWRRLLND